MRIYRKHKSYRNRYDIFGVEEKVFDFEEDTNGMNVNILVRNT